MTSRRTTIMATVAAAALVITPAVSAEAKPAKTYKNCTALNKVYKHGVAKKGARDRTSGTPVTTFKVSTKLYNANKKSDRDKDGVACEKK